MHGCLIQCTNLARYCFSFLSIRSLPAGAELGGGPEEVDKDGIFDFKNQELIESSFSDFMERMEEEARKLMHCEIVRNGLYDDKK